MMNVEDFVSATQSYPPARYDSEYVGVNAERLARLSGRVAAGAVSFEDAADELFNRATIALLARGAEAKDLIRTVRFYATNGYDAEYHSVNLRRARAACAELAEGRLLERFLDEVKDRVLVARVG